MTESSHRSVACLLAGLWLASGLAGAGDLSGSARIIYGPTETDDETVDSTNLAYAADWTQPISSWLSLALNYRFTLDRIASDTVADFERRSAQPEIRLTYARTRFSALLTHSERRIRGTSPADAFDLKSTLARFTYRPARGPSYVLSAVDETNVADVAIFARDNRSTIVNFESIQSGRNWEGRYGFETADRENRRTGYRIDQDRHQLRFDYQDTFFDRRALFGMGARIDRVEQSESAPVGLPLAQVVPASAGLFAIDTTPEVGMLDPVPDLIDGDLQSPVSPPIDIGGANSFRNIGLDFTVTRVVTRLEITVDAISDGALIWEVYGSTDNLTWRRIPGAISVFDQALLRYDITIPETSTRYVKAVNVSVSATPAVQVTEMRALVEVITLDRSRADGTNYRLDLSGTVRPHERVTGTFGLGLRNADDSRSGGISREIREVNYDSLVTVDIPRDLTLSVGYRFADFSERTGRPLDRTQRLYSGALEWIPLETVRGVLRLNLSDEFERSRRIRRVESVGLNFATEIYPDLTVTSEVGHSQIDDPFAGFTQSVLRWSESLQSRPTADWSVGARAAVSWYDSTGTVSLSRIVNVDLFTTWQPVPFLVLIADGGIRDEGDSRSITQNYTVAWNPGRKLSLSFVYRDNDTEDLRRTTSSVANLSYVLARRLRFNASYLRSTTELLGVESEVTSARGALYYSF